MSRTFTTVVVVFLSLLLLADYAYSTKIKSHWANPSANASSLQFKKVLVMVAIEKALTRKVAEDKAVSIIEAGGAAHAIPSYTIIADDEVNDMEKAKAAIEGMDFDGVILMRSSDSKDQRKYDEEARQEERDHWSAYNSFWGAYGAAWGSAYNAMTTNDLTIYIETMFYSLKENKLIWAGITETKNPSNPAKVVGEIAEETTKLLQKEGLIAKKK